MGCCTTTNNQGKLKSDKVPVPGRKVGDILESNDQPENPVKKKTVKFNDEAELSDSEEDLREVKGISYSIANMDHNYRNIATSPETAKLNIQK